MCAREQLKITHEQRLNYSLDNFRSPAIRVSFLRSVSPPERHLRLFASK